MKFIHLTDTHLITPGRLLHGLDPAARLEACVQSVARQHGDAAFCVLTGDVADAGEATAYAALRASMSRLPMPVHLIPGNHDQRERFCAAFPDAATDEHGFVQSSFRKDGATFILLDTLEPTQGAGGALCTVRTHWLRVQLQQAGSGPVYLFMHHPPFDIGLPALDSISLADPGPFAEVVMAAGNVRHIFFGHVHRPVSGNWRGISFSTLFGTSHQTRLDLETKIRIHYTAEPPAYAVVLLEPESLVIHTCHFLEDAADIRNPANPG